MTNLIASLLLVCASGVVAQEYAGPVGTASNGTPVDRNVADAGANSASQRLMQPGLGQFGVGSLLLDRYDNRPIALNRFNPILADARTSHRYLMQSPGVTALMSRPNYIGPSPKGGWVLNQQTYDGAEILAYSSNTVFVLSPELLAPTKHQQVIDTAWMNNPHRVRPNTVGDPYAIMRDTMITGQPRQVTIENHPILQQNPNYVHPEIIERRKRWKAEREAESAKNADEAPQKQDRTESE